MRAILPSAPLRYTRAMKPRRRLSSSRPFRALTRLACLGLALAALALGSTAFARDGAATEEALREADRAFFAAIAAHPPTALETVLDEAFAYRTSRGAVIGKRALIGHLSQGLTRVAGTRSLRALHARSGDTAVVTGIAEVSVAETDGPRTVWSRYTHVWVQREGRWRLLYREADESPGKLPDSVSTPDLAP